MFARLKVGPPPHTGKGRRIYVQVVENSRGPMGRVRQRVIATLGRLGPYGSRGHKETIAALTAALADVMACKQSDVKEHDGRRRRAVPS